MIYSARYLIALVVVAVFVLAMSWLVLSLAPTAAAVARGVRLFATAQIERTRRVWRGGEDDDPPAPDPDPARTSYL